MSNIKDYIKILKQNPYIHHIIAIVILFIISVLCFGIFDSPRLFADDWCVLISDRIFNNIPSINWSNHRPLSPAMFSTLTSIFGLNLVLVYWMNTATLFISSVLIYVIMLRIIPQLSWVAFPIAIIYLLFPVDYTRTWLTMFPVIHTTMLCLLFVLFVSIDYLKKGGWWRYVFVLTGISLPLLGYEGQAGLAMAVPCLLAIFNKEAPLWRRIRLFAVLLIGILFIFWRFVIQPAHFGTHDKYVEMLVWTPALILNRFLMGITIFTTGWIDTISPYLGISSQVYFLGGVSVMILLGIASWWSYKYFFKQPIPSLNWEQKKIKIKYLAILLLNGMIIWVAGYIPAIILTEPNLESINSRVNLYAIPGASIVLVSLFAIFAVLISTSLPQTRMITFALLVPFILSGIFTQYCVQLESQRNWNEQKYVWNKLFKLLPSITDNTLVTIVIPRTKNINAIYRPPLYYPWEVGCGLMSLYNNESVKGGVIFDRGYFVTNPQMNETSINLTFYPKTIFVYIDPIKRGGRVINNLKEDLYLPFDVNGYYPKKNIILLSEQSQKYRWLVK